MSGRAKLKKGFTLIELTVAMAVSAVAMSMLIFCLMSINSFLQNKELQTEYINQLTEFKTSINAVFENYQTSSFVLNEQSSDAESLTLTSGSSEYVISYSENALYDNGEKVKEFACITAVNFSTQESLVKCKIKYGDNLTYTLILNKRV